MQGRSTRSDEWTTLAVSVVVGLDFGIRPGRV